MNHNPRASSAEWTIAARLLRPQGRRGELLADPASDLPNLLISGRAVRIAAPSTSGEAIDTTLESQWSPTGRNAGRLVLKLAGCDSISDAERLAGRDLLVRSSDLPALEPDTWFVSHLVGCTLFDRGTPVGEITGVQYAVAPDGRTRLPDAAALLEITLPASPPSELTAEATPAATPEPALVPFIKAWLDTVDLEHRRVVMHLPPGLLALETEPLS